MPRERLSLKARALGWLAQREHSRSELRHKLLRVARREQAERDAARASGGKAAAGPLADEPSPDKPFPSEPSPGDAQPRQEPGVEGFPLGCADPAECVDRLLDWLQAHRYLSDTRFVESRVHAREARFGNLRIRQELAHHGVEADGETLARLRDSEFDRAREVWRRKFGQPPADPRERARQMRFLGQRGFSADVVARVLRGAGDDDDSLLPLGGDPD